MPDNVHLRLSGNADSPKIAVLGGGGFIGTYLVLDLLHMGSRLNVLSHRTNPDFVSPAGQLETVRGSVDDEDSLRRCFSGCDQVYHLVGIIAETRTATFQKTVADGAAKVVSAALKEGVKKILYLSALGASADAAAKYHQTKWEAEQHIIHSGIDYTIFRPSIVYGVQDKFINRLASMVRQLPVVPVIGDGHYRLQPVYVEELCAVMAVSSREAFTSRAIYEVGGPESLTYLEILDIIMRVLNRRRRVVHIPAILAKGAAAAMELVLKPAPLTRDQLKMMETGSVCDHTIVEKAFGVSFSPLELQLQKYLGRR